MGFRIRGNSFQPALPHMVWVWWKAEVAREICICQYNHLPSHCHSSPYLLYFACCLSTHWEVYYSAGLCCLPFFVVFFLALNYYIMSVVILFSNYFCTVLLMENSIVDCIQVTTWLHLAGCYSESVPFMDLCFRFLPHRLSVCYKGKDIPCHRLPC